MSNNEWKPIATAPKDGRVVLVHAPFGESQNGIVAAPARYVERHWWRDNDGYGYTVGCRPTHWAEMPSMPGDES